jgi:hypothetical protein
LTDFFGQGVELTPSDYHIMRDHLVDVFFRAREAEKTGIPVSLARCETKANPRTASPKTDAFRRWFGRSQVVDKKGKPLVVYHGTKNEFTAFRPRSKSINTMLFGSQVEVERTGIFLTDNPEFAKLYGPRVLPLYASMQRPIELTERIIRDFADSIDPWKERELCMRARYAKPNWHMFDDELGERFVAYLRSEGYDGVTFIEDLETDTGWVESRTFVVFDPAQIKSATENVGTFDSTDPDIRHNPKTAKRTHPALWERVKAEITASSKGGRPGQWSARKAQFAVAEYQRRGGSYVGPKSADNALAKWTREEWRTRSGLPSLATGERYLPKRAIAALTATEYAETSAKKRAGMRRGQQFIDQPEQIAVKTAKYRKNGRRVVAYMSWYGTYWYSCTEDQWNHWIAKKRADPDARFTRADTTKLKNPPQTVYRDDRGRWGSAGLIPYFSITDFDTDEWEDADRQVQSYIRKYL